MMPQVAAQIKALELYTRRLMSGKLIGDRSSCIKGSGLEFDQIREYQIGDDVRFIDWNSSARMNKVLVKQFFEERNRVILLAVDISGSSFYGSSSFKYDALARAAGILALAGEYAKDHVGLILFSDKVHTYIPPHKGKKHVRFLLQKLFGITPCVAQTNINSVLEYLAQLRKKNALVFLISDFVQEHSFEKHVPLIVRMYDLVAIRVTHIYETNFPAVGLLEVHDIETGTSAIMDARVSGAINKHLQERLAAQENLFKRYHIDALTLNSDVDILNAFIRFFRQRKK